MTITTGALVEHLPATIRNMVQRMIEDGTIDPTEELSLVRCGGGSRTVTEPGLFFGLPVPPIVEKEVVDAE